jgi:hypothetical protein
MLAESPIATLYTRGFSSFVASTTALIATGWSDKFPGGTFTHGGPAPFTAHDISCANDTFKKDID